MKFARIKIVFKPLSIIKKFIVEIPKLVWGIAACLGIFTMGFLVGIQATGGYYSSAHNYDQIKKENDNLKELVGGYEDLSSNYLLQRQDVGVILSRDLINNNPEEVGDALRSLDDQRDAISVLIGRVLELRKAAGLPELTNFNYGPNTKN